MTDLLTALGLMLVLEGSIYALFPEAMKRVTAQTSLLAPGQLRMIGLILALVGFVFVAFIRSQHQAGG